MIHFYDRQPAIFAHLSNGNNPTSFRTLNGDNAILVPVGSILATFQGEWQQLTGL